MERLNEIIRAVHESVPAPLPSTCLYKVFCDNKTSTTSGAISEDVRLIAMGCEDSSINVWDLLPTSYATSNWEASNEECGEQSQSRPPNPPSQLPFGYDRSSPGPSERATDGSRDRRVLLGHSGPVYDLSFVPSMCQKEPKDLLLSVSRDKSMRLWDISKGGGYNLAVYRGHSYPVWCVDVDRIGFSVVTGSMDRTAKLWQLEYTYPLRAYAGHERDVDVVKFHPNCNYVATGSADKTVRLWSHADAKMVRVFNGNQGGVYSLAFSPDGKLLASGGEDTVVRIWDIASSTIVKELKGHTDIIYSLVWSADSSLMASSGLDGTIRLWDVKSSSKTNTEPRLGSYTIGYLKLLPEK